MIAIDHGFRGAGFSLPRRDSSRRSYLLDFKAPGIETSLDAAG